MVRNLMRWEERHISWWDENRKCEVLRFFPSRPQSGWHWRIWEYPDWDVAKESLDGPTYYSQEGGDGMKTFATVIRGQAGLRTILPRKHSGMSV